MSARQQGESLREYAARLRAEAAAANPAPPTYDDDLIPDIAPEADRSVEMIEMDAVLGRIDILEAYRRWCGKMNPDPAGRRESIMVSCPNPAHPDKNPSAWISLDKGDGGVGNCGSCEMGFDKYDIAAWHFGYPVPDYKSKELFPKLRADMAGALGYRVMVSGKDEWLEKIQPDDRDAEGAPDAPTSASAPVVEGSSTASAAEPSASQPPSELPDRGDPSGLSFDWRTLPIGEDTFLAKWMRATSESYEPEEFYFFEGLMALGSAVGNRVVYKENPNVRANLLTCLVAGSGSGKSRSTYAINTLLHRAMPWQAGSSGVRLVTSPGSGEALIDQFVCKTTDVNTGTVEFHPVNGFYVEPELATLVKRHARSGNTSREVIMSLYDSSGPVGVASRSGGEVRAVDHFMGCLTTTQPNNLDRLLSMEDLDAGFLNRWVYVFGTNKIRPAWGTREIYFDDSVDALQTVRAWSMTSRMVDFRPPDPALDAWEQFYYRTLYPTVVRAGEENPILSRLDLLCKKLLLLFAINDRMTTITVRHVECVIELYKYLVSCFMRVREDVSHGEVDACAEKILRYLEARPDQTFTARDLLANSGARKFGRGIIEKALGMLQGVNEVEEVPRSKSERVVRYRVVERGTTPLATVTNLHPK